MICLYCIRHFSGVFLLLLAVAGPGQAFLSFIKRQASGPSARAVTFDLAADPLIPVTPAPQPCQDAAAIDCSLPGLCSDAEFASLLCPVTCGRCSNLAADCSSPEGFYCLTHPDVCSDIELAVIMCPHLCGFCAPGAHTFEPTPSTTTAVETASATTAPDTALPVCPTCTAASHTMDCLSNLQVCNTNQVCKGSVDDWKLSMRCTSPLICGFEELQSNRNCTSGQPFAPQEHCTFCCHGDECARDLGLVQKGLNKIPTVVHCPSCVNETDPRGCAERIVPCDTQHTVCEIVNNHGLFTAKCGDQNQCTESVAGNSCRLGYGVCSFCCHDSECLTQAFAVGLPTADPAPTEAPTVAPCEDADFYPCQFAKDVACADEDMSLTVCPVTCGRCGEL